MVVALDDTAGLSVFEDPKQVQVYCEANDVEDGVYEFWNDRAQRLKAKFVEPNRRRRLWFFESIVPGKFELEPERDVDPDGFRRFLDRATYLSSSR